MSCVDAIGSAVVDGAAGAVNDAIGALTDMLHAAIKSMALVLAGWLLVPSTQVCSAAVYTCNTDPSPAAMLRGWMLPLTILITVAGITWQAVQMVISRKGEPLLVIIKGLASVALWGAVGLAGTQLALRAGDSYAYWILQQAIFGDSLNPVDDVGEALAGMATDTSIASALVMFVLLLPFLLVTIAQVLLMIFREGAVILLAGQLQLAAAGGFTRITSGWLGRVTGWMLALIAYKYVAATVYAVAFALMGDDDMRNVLMGLAVMLLCVVAMPALLRLFNWTVGTLGSAGGGGLGVLASATAAGLHGAATLRGPGGYGPGEHARYLDDHGPGSTGAGAAPAAGGMPSGPSAGGSLAGGGPVAGAGAGGAAAAGAGVAAGAATAGAGLVVDAVRRSAQAADDAMAGQ